MCRAAYHARMYSMGAHPNQRTHRTAALRRWQDGQCVIGVTRAGLTITVFSIDRVERRVHIRKRPVGTVSGLGWIRYPLKGQVVVIQNNNTVVERGGMPATVEDHGSQCAPIGVVNAT